MANTKPPFSYIFIPPFYDIFRPPLTFGIEIIMFPNINEMKIYLVCGKTDLRKGTQFLLRVDIACFSGVLLTNKFGGKLSIMSEENLEKIIAQQATTIQNLTDEIKLLREQVAYLTQKRYGKSSEQMPLSGQLNLFDEEKQDSDDGERPRCRRSDYYL